MASAVSGAIVTTKTCEACAVTRITCVTDRGCIRTWMPDRKMKQQFVRERQERDGEKRERKEKRERDRTEKGDRLEIGPYAIGDYELVGLKDI